MNSFFRTIFSVFAVLTLLLFGQAQAKKTDDIVHSPDVSKITTYSMLKDTIIAYYAYSGIVRDCLGQMNNLRQSLGYVGHEQEVNELISGGIHYPDQNVQSSASELICLYHLTQYEDTLINVWKQGILCDGVTLECIGGKKTLDFYKSFIGNYKFDSREIGALWGIADFVSKDSTLAPSCYPAVSAYYDSITRFFKKECPNGAIAEDEYCMNLESCQKGASSVKNLLAKYKNLPVTAIPSNPSANPVANRRVNKNAGIIYDVNGKIIIKKIKGPGIYIKNGKLFIDPMEAK